MDVEAVYLANEETLKELGISAKGDILSLKAYCQRESTSAKPYSDYDERKQQLINQLKKGKSGRLPMSERSKQTHETTTRNRKLMIGWMNFSSKQQRFVTVRLSSGGGVRQLDVPGNATKSYLINKAKELFFPNGVSSIGKACDMIFDIANFKEETIPENTTVDMYIENHKLTRCRLYLTSKSLQEDVLVPFPDKPGTSGIQNHPMQSTQNSSATTVLSSDSDDDYLFKPALSSETAKKSSCKRKYQDKGREWRRKYASKNDESDSDSDEFSSTLIGTSQDRKTLKEEQNKEFAQSLLQDRQKEQKKEQDAVETRRLKEVQQTRTSRIPPEPTSSQDRVRIAVNHITKGKLVRYFSRHEQMLSVYDWIGSLSPEPEHFILRPYAGQTVYPSESVRDVVLYMEETDSPIKIDSDEDQEVSFKGYGSVAEELPQADQNRLER